MSPLSGTNPCIYRPVAPYEYWSQTAQCAISLFYRNRITRAVLCDECFADCLEPTQFERVYRHYLHIGVRERHEECSECFVILASARPYNNCNVCTSTRAGFLNYLRDTGDDPYNNIEPTIIAITQRVTRVTL